MPRSVDVFQAHQIAGDSEINQGSHLMDLLGASTEPNHQAQRLSLSLGSRVLVPSVHYRQRPPLNSNLTNSTYIFTGEEGREACNPQMERLNDDYIFSGGPFAPCPTSADQSCSTSYRAEPFVIAIGSSRYLKPAQSLLEEVVNVGGKAIDLSNEKYVKRLSRNSRRGSLVHCSELQSELCNNGFSADKHELQAKITKLIGLLEEVESRYEQYHHRMEEVVSSFEVIAGPGAGRSYTALALQAMSRHFCRLRNAIISQINVSKRKFVKELPKISMDLSQLQLFDQDTRQSRLSLQQIGMSQSQRQTWRPIRGLPETSVATLRSWLFEHFLHPYPNDTEKLILASQTGLTKNQVSNWFINARVRLWKPMIEEMYKEEFADSSVDSNPLLASSSLTREGVTFTDEEE